MDTNVVIIRTPEEQSDELKRLNNELAIYVQKVRRLTLDNDRLKEIISRWSDDVVAQRRELRNFYEIQLDDLRRQLCESAKLRAKAEIESEDRIKQFHEAQKKLENLEIEIDRLKEAVQKEKLENVDLLQKNQNLKDDVVKKHASYEKEIDLLRRANQAKIQIPEIDDRLLKELENRFDAQVNGLRDKMTHELLSIDKNMKNTYENRIQELMTAAKNGKHFTDTMHLECNKLLSDNLVLSQNNEKLNQERQALNEKFSRLEKDLNEIRKKYNNDIKNKDDKLIELGTERDRIKTELDRYIALNSSLDQELEIYKKLLAEEQTRLSFLEKRNNISNVTLTSTKDYSMSSGNNIVIAQKEGDYVSIFNILDKDYNIPKGSSLRVNANNKESSYKFEKDITIPVGSSIKIWRKNNNENDNQNNYYSTNKEWPTGDRMEAVLVNNVGCVLAIRHNFRNNFNQEQD